MITRTLRYILGSGPKCGLRPRGPPTDGADGFMIPSWTTRDDRPVTRRVSPDFVEADTPWELCGQAPLDENMPREHDCERPLGRTPADFGKGNEERVITGKWFL